jgi:Fe-S-cluster-containing hydrogenase component 2
MRKQLAIVPELCSGCRLCEITCAVHRQKVNNPKKANIRVTTIYPHPVVRMPVVCSQCKEAKCMDACPVDAFHRRDGVVHLKEEVCIGCRACVRACPFGAMYLHPDRKVPLKCDLCADNGEPQCVKMCPTGAIAYMPEHVFGQTHRLHNVLSYAHMKEIEYMEKGKRKRLHYADNNAPETSREEDDA